MKNTAPLGGYAKSSRAANKKLKESEIEANGRSNIYWTASDQFKVFCLFLMYSGIAAHLNCFPTPNQKSFKAVCRISIAAVKNSSEVSGCEWI